MAADVAPLSGALFPVSIKGVVVVGGRVLVLRNERAEWELPGGRLEPGEPPEACLAREIAEETGLAIEPEAALDSWLYRVRPGHEVLIVTYGCRPLAAATPRISAEHDAVALVDPAELAALPMPEGYRASVRRWLKLD